MTRIDPSKLNLEERVVQINRVAKVGKGGRRFSFSLVVVIGDHKGRVGVGLGKGVDTALAIDKATRDAKKHLIAVRLTDDACPATPSLAPQTHR